MSVEDPVAKRRQRDWAETLQIPREKHNLHLGRCQRRPNGRVQGVWRGMGHRGKMMCRNACSPGTGQRPGTAVVANDGDDLALNPSGRTAVENALKRRALVRGENPDLQ